jgi:ribosomal protein S18 acetylase RimI-like enzyme
VPVLRKYRPEDFERLVEIDQACFVEGIAYTREEMCYFLGLSSALTLVAVLNDAVQNDATQNAAAENGSAERETIQGFIIADRYRQRRDSHYMGRIITIEVMASGRSSGVGSLLIAAAEKELQLAGCDYVVLEVAVDNDHALRFYKKHGYSVLKVLPRYYLDSIDGLLMGKKL